MSEKTNQSMTEAPEFCEFAPAVRLLPEVSQKTSCAGCAIFGVLHSFYRNGQPVYPSNDALASLLNLNKRTVSRQLRLLEENGFIKRVMKTIKRGTRKFTERHFIVLEDNLRPDACRTKCPARKDNLSPAEGQIVHTPPDNLSRGVGQNIHYPHDKLSNNVLRYIETDKKRDEREDSLAPSDFEKFVLKKFREHAKDYDVEDSLILEMVVPKFILKYKDDLIKSTPTEINKQTMSFWLSWLNNDNGKIVQKKSDAQIREESPEKKQFNEMKEKVEKVRFINSEGEHYDSDLKGNLFYSSDDTTVQFDVYYKRCIAQGIPCLVKFNEQDEFVNLLDLKQYRNAA